MPQRVRALEIHQPITLAEAARDASRLDDLDSGQVAALLLEVSALEVRLASRLARLAEDRHIEGGDRLLDVTEAATLLGVAKDWLRRRDLPFAVRLSAGAVRYSARGIEQWIAKRTGRV